MWENCHDYDAEVEAQMKPKPAPHVDLDRLDALFAAATKHYAIGVNRLTANRDKALEWAESTYNAYPSIAAELRTLRAQVAELEDDSEALEDGTRAYLDLTAERDRLRAERDAARDEAAGLREALKSINRLDENGNSVIKGWSEIDEIIRTALTRTPAQHRARIVAAGLLEAAERLRKQDCSDEAARTYEWLIAEAERLEKEAGNGIG